MRPISVSSSPLSRILRASEPLSRLQDHAARLLRLQKALDKALPPVMKNAVRVANFQDGVLFLHVPSPALATRLKLGQEGLRAALLASGENVFEFKIKVRVDRHDREQRFAPHRHISEQGREALEALRKSLKADDPLARALKKMEDDSA